MEVEKYSKMQKILLIDNYDSFTYNLLHYLEELGAEVTVKRNDAISTAEVMASKPDAILLSPGPCTPDKAGICLDLIAEVSGKIPILGVCLGHQTIAQSFGGNIIRAETPMHGKVSTVIHNNKSVFADIPTPFNTTRYHSLIVERKTLPDCLEITAETEDGVIMGIMHRELSIHGVQFHPESIASEYGHEILSNFLKIV